MAIKSWKGVSAAGSLDRYGDYTSLPLENPELVPVPEDFALVRAVATTHVNPPPGSYLAESFR